jgi:hypothetical protein
LIALVSILCVYSARCASAVSGFAPVINRRDAEHAEEAQRESYIEHHVVICSP